LVSIVNPQGLLFDYRGKMIGQILRYQFPKRITLILLALASMPFVASAAFQPIQFAPPLNFNLGGPLVDRLCVADFNGDGFLDLAVGYGNHVAILTNDGTGTMQLWTNFSAQGALGAGDFNGDHKTDLVTVGSLVTVWLNNGNGAFTGTNIDSQYAYGNAVAVGDFNRDQKLDLAIGGLSVFLGQGKGAFTFQTNYPAAANAIAIADFDGNTLLDLAIVYGPGTSSTSVLLGNGNGTFDPPTNYPGNSYTYCVATGDFNSDGKPDIVTGNFLNRLITLRLNNGDGTFGAAKTVALPISPSAVGVADFNGDGNLDVVAGNPLVILPGFGDGTFASPVTNLSSFSPREGANQSLVVADFDDDGRPDIATCSVTNNCVSILLNRTPPPVSISIQNASGLLVLNWTDKPGFGLEFTTNLGLPNSWSTVTNPSFVVNGQRIVVTTATSENGFFRLRKP
jgi:FG-GAP-like repeat